MKLVIDISDQFAQGLKILGLNEEQAGLLLRDALGEFVSARHPVSTYVSNRYKGNHLSFQESKIAEVMTRITWATFIKAGQVRLEE